MKELEGLKESMDFPTLMHQVARARAYAVEGEVCEAVSKCYEQMDMEVQFRTRLLQCTLLQDIEELRACIAAITEKQMDKPEAWPLKDGAELFLPQGGTR